MQRYDDRTALVIVDLQNDFADPAGGLAVHGGPNLVPIVNAEIEMARSAGATVVLTQDWHPESTPHFAKDGGIWPVHCVAGTWGAELHPDLDADAAGSAPRIRKGEHGEDGYSGFSMRDPVTGAQSSTPLDALLRDAGIEHVVVCGLATDYCVRASAIDACREGFDVIVVGDAVRGVEVNAGDSERAFRDMRDAGARIATSDEVLAGAGTA